MNQKKIICPNFSNFPRRDYFTGTVPFKKGEWFGEDNLYIEEDGYNDSYVRPFGLPYNDGSFRYGEIIVPVDLKSGEQKVLTLNKAPKLNQRPSFDFGPDINKRLAKFRLTVGFTFGQSGWETYTIGSFTVVEDLPNRKVLRFRHRIRDFVIQIYLYVYKGQDYIPYSLSIKGSNPNTTLKTHSFDELRLNIEGAIADIRGNIRKRVVLVPNTSENKLAPTGVEYILATKNWLGDGQGFHPWYGNIYFAGENDEMDLFAATESDAIAIATADSWRDAGCFGPFGKVPLAQMSDADKINWTLKAWQAHRQLLFTPADLFDDLSKGLTKNPGQTGDQEDFGVSKLWHVVDSGRPELLSMYFFHALEEYMRPTHYLETDGSPVQSKNHPDWVTWGQETHYHFQVSKDRLGKTDPNAIRDSHGWSGKDNEHWSSNLLNEVYLLYPRYELLDELNTEAEAFLAGHTIPSQKPGWSTNGAGAARAIGRVYLSMAQNVLATGRLDVKERLRARFRECIDNVVPAGKYSPVQPLNVMGPDARVLPSNHFWMPWQEAIGVVGLEAVARVIEDDSISEFAKKVAISQVTFGWQTVYSLNRLVSAKVGHGVRWDWNNPGVPITAEQYFDETRTYFLAADYLEAWTPGCLRLVASYWQVPEDIKQKASEILDYIRSSRPINYDNKYFEWDCTA